MARVTLAATRGETRTTSSGRALPVVVSMRALTSRFVKSSSTWFSPLAAVSPATPTASAVVFGSPLPPGEPSGLPNSSRLAISSWVRAGSACSLMRPFSTSPMYSA
jgi:hypothetical protein